MKLRTVLTLIVSIVALVSLSATAGHHESGVKAKGKSKVDQIRDMESDLSEAAEEVKAKRHMHEGHDHEMGSEDAEDDDHDGDHHDGHDEDYDDDIDGAKEKAKGKAKDLKAKGNAKADEMRARRDQSKAIKKDYKDSVEPGASRAGKKPWWKFWGADEAEAAAE